MSLTTILKNREVKELFAKELQKPTSYTKKTILAPPISKNYALVGTAFDYLLRFEIERKNTNVVTQEWIAEASVKLMCPIAFDMEFTGTYTHNDECKTLFNSSEKSIKSHDLLESSKTAYNTYIRDGIICDDILKACVKLAQLDSYYRCGRTDPHLGIVCKDDIQDLRNLINLVKPEDFKTEDVCILNPSFNKASKLVEGADADLVIGNKLIDIKTTKNPSLTTEMWNQLVGYYILGIIDGVGVEKYDILDIEEIGIYFSRSGVLEMYNVEEVIGVDVLYNLAEKFTDLVVSLRNRRKR